MAMILLLVKNIADKVWEMKSNEWWGNFWIFFSVSDNIADMENVGVVAKRVDQWGESDDWTI